ncbi:hypothetical protein JYK00_07625 [Thermosipho ferrireducens]|uniref:Cation antiporter n=1 Tax=Thermosipho ferrireducens TaxID=2571116 RepID=A0ABX7S8I3_9BACT|nr:hypothetical protein [Thermosipho ferrireducens]QTA37593.1 hypothetical protein JYK00_07625 [Thermosipho ferrireducens]
MLNLILTILFGSFFLTILTGIEYFFYNILISSALALIIYPGKFPFLRLIGTVAQKIPEAIIETVEIFFLKKETVYHLEYKDNFEMLERIIYITFTPKTLVFDHDEDYLYVHKIGSDNL